MMKRLGAALLFFTILQVVAAAEIRYFGMDTRIEESGVATVSLVIIPEVPGNYTFRFSAKILNFSSDSCFSRDSEIVCQNMKDKAEVKFKTDDFFKEENLFYRVEQETILPGFVKRVTNLITLPEGMVVANLSDAVYPPNYSTLSNGRNILIYWELENISYFQPLFFRVVYRSVRGGISIGSLLIVAVVAAVLSALLIYHRARKPEEVILSVLDNQERRVFEVVRKATQINQRKVVRITDYSKATVSRIVRRLVERGLITVERRGRTNILKVRRRVFWKNK